MENPLHERLRVTESFGSSLCLNMEKVTPDIIDTSRCDSKVCGECFAEWTKALADEIESEYVTKEQHEADIEAIVEAQKGLDGSTYSAEYVIKTWADHHSMPMKDGECITEWLDRWFYALPCDKNGEPWRIGDGCVTAEGEDGTVVGYRANGRVFVDLHDERCFARCYASDLKRPAAKMLDDDGEIPGIIERLTALDERGA